MCVQYLSVAAFDYMCGRSFGDGLSVYVPEGRSKNVSPKGGFKLSYSKIVKLSCFQGIWAAFMSPIPRMTMAGLGGGVDVTPRGAHHEEPEQVLPQAQSIPILRSGASRPAQGQRLAVNRRNTGERGGRTGWPHLLTKSGHLIRVHQQGLRSEAATAAFISTRILKENTNRDGC